MTKKEILQNSLDEFMRVQKYLKLNGLTNFPKHDILNTS